MGFIVFEEEAFNYLDAQLENFVKRMDRIRERSQTMLQVTYRIWLGEDANIIFGAMYDDSVADYARITVIATGLTDNNLQNTPFGNRASNSVFGNTKKTSQSQPGGMNLNMPSFSLPTMNSTQFGTKAPTSTVQKKDIQIPDFLRTDNK